LDHSLPVFDLLSAGLLYCRGIAVDHHGLLSSLFVAGLFGSIGHCTGMCGPLVLGQVVARMQTVPAAEMRELHRLSGALLVPYHLGRLTTYTTLGAFAAALAGKIADAGQLRWLSATLLAMAALLFAGYAVQRLGVAIPWLAQGGESWWSRRVGKLVKPLFLRPIGVRGYLLGVALGFLPCGLVYGAVAAAASSGDALAGGLGLAAFTAGTVPALVAVGIAGHVAGVRWQGAVARLTPLLLMLNAAALTYMAWQALA
jgi:hypothetical protein